MSEIGILILPVLSIKKFRNFLQVSVVEPEEATTAVAGFETIWIQTQP